MAEVETEVGASSETQRTRVGAARDWILGAWDVVRLTLPSVVIPVVAGVLLCAVPQGLEALRVIAEDADSFAQWRLNPSPVLWVFGLTAVAGLAAWYCARVALYVYVPDTQELATGPAREIPRIWGMIPPLTVAAGYLILTTVRSVSDGTSHWWYCIGGVVLAILLYLSFISRRAAINAIRSRYQEVGSGHPSRHERKGHRPSLVGLPLFSKLAFAAIAVLWIAVCVRIVWKQGAGTQRLTSPGIVMLSAAAWITLITWLLYESRRHGIAFVRWVLFAAVLFSFFNFNEDHRVREEPEDAGRVLPPVPDTIALARWYDSRPDKKRYGDRYPMFIVAAEGGGIRAAMIAALTMGYLTDVCPVFPIHTFAVSGVSGGSVGSAAYVAVARQYAAADTAAPCRTSRSRYPLAQSLSTVVDQDFLTPPLAEGLYPDILAWFVPIPLAGIDRARALELAFARAVEPNAPGHEGAMLFEHSFLGNATDTLLRWDPTGSVPALILNTTRVETGERVLVSQIQLPDTGVAGALSTYDIDPQLDLPFSTAATLSARFPVISPEGVIVPKAPAAGEPHTFRLVDGGYYDNSGLATAMALAEFVRRHERRVMPVIIRVGYAVKSRPEPAARWGAVSALQPWAEALSPVRSVLNARDAHTADEIASLERLTQVTTSVDTVAKRAQCPHGCPPTERRPIRAAELLLPQGNVPYILGWLISHRAVTAALDTLRPPSTCLTPPRPTAAKRTGPVADAAIPSDTGNAAEYCAIFRMLEGTPDTTVRLTGLR